MKHHNWQILFEAFIGQRRALPFAWGTNDCVIFASDCVLALTGTDPVPEGLRGLHTAKRSYRAIRGLGGLTGIATTALGEPMPAAFAQVGDVVLTKAGKRDMLAICNGGTAIAPAAVGLAHIDMATASLCWRVA